jgi:hypothetical protein
MKKFLSLALLMAGAFWLVGCGEPASTPAPAPKVETPAPVTPPPAKEGDMPTEGEPTPPPADKPADAPKEDPAKEDAAKDDAKADSPKEGDAAAEPKKEE